MPDGLKEFEFFGSEPVCQPVRKLAVSFVAISSLLFLLALAGCGSSSPAITVTLSPSTAQTIDQGQAVNITASLTNDSANKGVTWSLGGVGTLASQTPTSVTYDAPSSVSSPSKVTVTATSAADTSVTAALAITVNPGPTITTTSLPDGVAGSSYNETLAESGGTGPFTWGVVSGQIPPGLSLNSGGGGITGTPTSPGTFNFTVQISDSAQLTSKQALSIVIKPAPALAITTTALPNGALNDTYSAQLNATGGVSPYGWSLASGSLPPGLELKTSGIISGTPTTVGTSTFAVQVADSQTPTATTVTGTFSITINPTPFSITTTSLPEATVGIAYSTTLQVSGGVPPIAWSVVSGSLPGWASLNTSTGVISGTPTATGTSSFSVQATDSETPAAVSVQALTLTVAGTQNGLLSGQYAFALSGYRGGVAGSFTADGKGNITGGTEDLENSPSTSSAVDVAISSGTYAVGTDYRGTLTYTDANNNTFTFAIALSPLSSAVAAQGAMIETDASGNRFTGFLDLQDPSAFSTAAISGNYVFGLTGWDASGNSSVVVGTATVANGTVSGGTLDANDGGTVDSSVAFTGTLNVSSSGRGTLTSGTAQANMVFYVVSSSKLLAIAIDPKNGAVATGLIQEQTVAAYSDSSVYGTMVMDSESATSVPAPQASLGVLTSPGDGTASFSLDDDAGGALSLQTGSGTFTFDSSASGRFTLSLQTQQGQISYVGYMLATNKAVIMGTGSQPSFGSFQPQETGPFTSTSLNGSYFFGSQPLVAAPSTKQPALVASGEMTFDGTSALSGTMDSAQGGTVTATQLTDTYTVASSGRVTLVPGTAILYIVSDSKAMALYIGSAAFPNPFIQVVER